VAFAALCIPFRTHGYGVIPNFLQAYGIVLGASEVLTSVLLLWRARSSPDGRLATLAATYAFSAPLIIANVVTLPGVTAPPGSFPFQAAPWIWVFWHVGWGAGMVMFALSPGRAASRPELRWLLALALSVAAIAAALYDVGLPRILNADGTFPPFLYALYLLALAICVVALQTMVRRWRRLTTLELWVVVAVLALALDVLFTMISTVRFSLGFYVARILGMVSGTVVLAALFNDFARLIRRADVLDQYAILAEHLPQVAFITDAERRCLFVNSAWTELTGQTPDAAQGYGYRALMHPDDLAASLDLPLDNGQERAMRFRAVDGTAYRRHVVRAVPLRSDSFGEATGFVVTAIDVEDRARADAALHESDSRLRTFLETVPQIVWTADAGGWIDWYNPRWFEYTGQTPEEAAGWGWQAAHHPEDFPAVMERLRGQDGSFQWFLTRIVPDLDEHGRVQRWYGSNTNIDAQKRDAQRSARIARIMQEAFLPERLPQRSDLRFDALYLTAESEAFVGGDWYDAFTLPDGRILISCGDVAGHGLDAAILAGRFRQSIALAGLEDADPARVLARVNRIAMLQGEGITTAVVAVLDHENWTLDYALAGHPPLVVATPTEIPRTLASGGLPLGVLENASWDTVTVALEPDAVVIFYSDGVTEFAHDIMAAEQRLCEAANKIAGDGRIARPALAVKEFVMGGAAPRDDVAILVVQLSPSAADHTREEGDLTKKWRFHSSDALTAHNARKALAEYLASRAANASDLYEAELVIGEAIANTVEHAPGLVEVFIDWRAERPALTVRDTGPGFAVEGGALPIDAMAEDGRGMFLIHALASDVVVRRSPGFGTELSCVLPVRRAETAA